MSFFSWRRKTVNISDVDPVYKVKYLGNIHTCMMKGDGCVDKPAMVLWNNYLQSSHQALDMKMVVSVSGINAHTKEQGLMQYSSHKISYIIAHPQYPRMFLWVYRHEGRKMKLDLRCHAVLCKTETKAKLLAVQLHDKLSFALKEFVRDKRRKHSSRLIMERTKSDSPHGCILPLRQQMLSQGSKFKPPVSKMNSAPKLVSICELDEEEEECIGEDEDLNGSLDEDGFCIESESDLSDGLDVVTLDGGESDSSSFNSERIINLEIGNDIDELKHDDDVKFYMDKKRDFSDDGESSESGFSDSSKEIGLYNVDECSEEGGGGGERRGSSPNKETDSTLLVSSSRAMMGENRDGPNDSNNNIPKSLPGSTNSCVSSIQGEEDSRGSNEKTGGLPRGPDCETNSDTSLNIILTNTENKIHRL